MKTIGAVFKELPVAAESNDELTECYTDQVCETIGADHYRIDGRAITLPVVVADASMMLNVFLVDAALAQSMIDGSGFRVIELFPGKAILQLLFVDYRNNDLGDYNEAAIMFPVLTPGEKKPFPFFGALKRMATGRAGNYVYRMPVDQAFTTHAGRYIWGFPKWLAKIDISFGDKRVEGQFFDEGELVFSLAAKAGGNTVVKQQRAASLAIRGGKAWKTYGSSTGSGLTFSLGGAIPGIGETHPLAKELRSLGLPKKPLFTLSMKHTAMSFEGPETVAIGQAFK